MNRRASMFMDAFIMVFILVATGVLLSVTLNERSTQSLVLSEVTSIAEYRMMYDSISTGIWLAGKRRVSDAQDLDNLLKDMNCGDFEDGYRIFSSSEPCSTQIEQHLDIIFNPRPYLANSHISGFRDRAPFISTHLVADDHDVYLIIGSGKPYISSLISRNPQDTSVFGDMSTTITEHVLLPRSLGTVILRLSIIHEIFEDIRQCLLRVDSFENPGNHTCGSVSLSWDAPTNGSLNVTDSDAINAVFVYADQQSVGLTLYDAISKTGLRTMVTYPELAVLLNASRVI